MAAAAVASPLLRAHNNLRNRLRATSSALFMEDIDSKDLPLCYGIRKIVTLKEKVSAFLMQHATDQISHRFLKKLLFLMKKYLILKKMNTAPTN